jgi:hypothetical protein
LSLSMRVLALVDLAVSCSAYILNGWKMCHT